MWLPPSKVTLPLFWPLSLDNGKTSKRQGDPNQQPGQPAALPGSDLLNLFLPPGAQNPNSVYAKKGLDPVKVKQDIVKALADPGLSKDIVVLADELLEKRR